MQNIKTFFIVKKLKSFFLRLNATGNLHQRRVEGYFGLNQQLYDLGLPKQDLFNMDLVKVFI